MGSFSTDVSVTVGAEEEARAGGSGHDHREGKQEAGESPGGHKVVMQGNAGNRKVGMFLSIANLRSH